MTSEKPITVRGVYRATSHLPLWEVMEKAGIWEQAGIEMDSFAFLDDPPSAEAALFEGSIDFISGNHITPYALLAEGKPIVSISSPVNGKRERIVTREPIKSLSELWGKRIFERPLYTREAGIHHGTGNHVLYVIQAGVPMDEVEWVSSDEEDHASFHQAALEALRTGKADATFGGGNIEDFEKAGFHVLQLDHLPMINGPTLTTSIDRLNRGDQIGERLVKAQVLGIHYAHTHREETELILEDLRSSHPEVGRVTYQSLARMPAKPYPDPIGIANAYALCKIQKPEVDVNPMALWDMHYLRELDYSGFIDQLYQTEA